MQLRNARLCLDCEEVHEAQHCPVCASETFAFIARWVPLAGRRGRARPPEPENPEDLETYRGMIADDINNQKSPGWKLVRHGALGLALFGVAGWLWKTNSNDRAPKDTRYDEHQAP